NCPGNAAACPPVQQQQCPSGLCDSGGQVCSGGCSASNPCPSNQYCAGGTCTTKKPDGQTCGASTECVNGNCVDGVCCNGPCGGGANDCQACNLNGKVGVCSPVAQGTVCRATAGACDAAEACDGASLGCPGDAKQPSSVTCRSAAGPCDAAE